MLNYRRTVPWPTEIPEVVLNLWYFAEESNGLVYRLAGRAYALIGSDEQKLKILRKLAATDFHIAKVFPVPKRFKTVIGHNTFEGATSATLANEDPSGLFKEVIDALEADLPTQMRSINENPQTYCLKIPEDPLMVCTCVVEHEDGTLEPRLGKDSIDGD